MAELDPGTLNPLGGVILQKRTEQNIKIMQEIVFQTEKRRGVFLLFNRQKNTLTQPRADVCTNKSPLRTLRSLFVLLELLYTNLQQGQNFLLNFGALRDG